MSYQLEFTQKALRDIKKLKKKKDKYLLNKLNDVLLELQKHPLIGIGKPEPLKHDYQGFYSRRLNKEHRIIYKVEEDKVIVFVYSAFGHYDD